MLAAGASSRYGANKLLEPFGGGSVLGAVVAAALASQASPVMVVTGHARAAVEAALPRDSALVVAHNPEHAEGEWPRRSKLDSYGCASTPRRPGALIILGDLPLLSSAMLNAVLARAAQGGALIVAPRYQGQRGHPVWLAREVWAEAMALKPGAQLRELLRARPGDVLLFDVDDPAILMDVDTPEQMREARDAQHQQYTRHPDPTRHPARKRGTHTADGG
ncbi:MAG: nucleotidyltransferase family protein [Anaerolineae bacterium]|nr:nucleotidyltransferase family protein [Anaerolineae bacterium]